MGRKSKVSKELKIKACLNYEKGLGSFESIGDSLGVRRATVLKWYNAYEIHGEKSFEESNTNSSYTKDFKMKIIQEYKSAKLSGIEIAAKYNITCSMVYKWINKYNEGIELSDYNPNSEVYTMKSIKKNKEEKLEIIKYVLANDKDYKGAALKYGVRYQTVYLWVTKYLKDGESALNDKKRGPRIKKINLDEMPEVDRLKYLLAEEKKKREIAEFKVEALKKKQEIEERLYRK